MATFPVDLRSLQKKFPKGLSVPPLLQAFGEWVSTVQQGSLGYFERMAGGKFADDALSTDVNKTIDSAIGVFLWLGEGSMVALWQHGEGPPAVVLLDSEGQHRGLAPTLEAFLVAWSKQKTGTALDGNDVDDDQLQRHADLAAWLARKKISAEKRKVPDFGEWFDEVAAGPPPPKSGELVPPPENMAEYAIAAVGRSAADPKVKALLAALGIDFAKYKTADAQRHLVVPRHGYSLCFEKRKLETVRFAAEGLTAYDYVNGKDVRFAPFPHAVFAGVRTTDTFAEIKAKVGSFDSEDPEWGAYVCNHPSGVKVQVSLFTRGRRKGAVEYIVVTE